MGRSFVLIIFFISFTCCISQQPAENHLQVGAERMELYLPLLQNKKVGIFGNHTSLVGQKHLTDTLISLGVNIKTVFSPEHGFKGNKPDGEKITGEQSNQFKLISLYGKDKYPKESDIAEIDILLIDIQDVGMRCYTYASSMTYLMEVCAAMKVPVIILDRPNPIQSMIDGPVLDEKFESFVGLHPIPLAHGLTLGELAKMINGESWLKNGIECELTIIPVSNWKHDQPYTLPVPPSPNLPNQQAINLYPSLVLFEGTVVSVARGTDFPFQAVGHPAFTKKDFSFTPMPNAASKYPPLEGQKCFGLDLRMSKIDSTINLSYLIEFYKTCGSSLQDSFFNNYFTSLAGTDQLRIQIESGQNEEQIRKSWEADLRQYRSTRKKYLIYE